ncbi:translational machinery component [Hesseltinella vesiculosa]|uniref:Translational machinery component n=1 Tax=Hesseltinella vesiculosa TaxID=101127 RepID=A0A1X2GIP1_9FUNG|nr:translational machinery component [Hesseltinella vesiculosa]
MLSIGRQRLSQSVLCHSSRLATQQPRRWNSSDNTNGQNDSSDTPLSVQSLLNVLDANKDSQPAKTPVEGIASILQESTLKHQQRQQATDSNGYDLTTLTDQLHNMSQAPFQLHVNASFNNTIVTLTRPNGSPLVSASGGSAGFKKAQRSGYEAAHQAATQLLDKMNAKNLQVPNVHIILKGFGPGRDAAFKALVAGANWNVRRITDATPIPFGGCRPKKARRL